MDQPTRQEIERNEGNRRIHAYLNGGSLPVLISRAIVAIVIAVISAIVWWQGMSD